MRIASTLTTWRMRWTRQYSTFVAFTQILVAGHHIFIWGYNRIIRQTNGAPGYLPSDGFGLSGMRSMDRVYEGTVIQDIGPYAREAGVLMVWRSISVESVG
jgi:hypothetical protein